ncbi:hypothetical protein M6B38_205795 [Iris pallida]|uniref:Secreted protein n=1 Tax=Iris pallida TaxID=29817 RepID=A0AAX6E6L5_IRIPA|nr:hypothetical protein M6B38_205795 [Iris pallida]
MTAIIFEILVSFDLLRQTTSTLIRHQRAQDQLKFLILIECRFVFRGERDCIEYDFLFASIAQLRAAPLRYLEDMVPPWVRAQRWWSCGSGWT